MAENAPVRPQQENAGGALRSKMAAAPRQPLNDLSNAAPVSIYNDAAQHPVDYPRRAGDYGRENPRKHEFAESAKGPATLGRDYPSMEYMEAEPRPDQPSRSDLASEYTAASQNAYPAGYSAAQGEFAHRGAPSTHSGASSHNEPLPDESKPNVYEGSSQARPNYSGFSQTDPNYAEFSHGNPKYSQLSPGNPKYSQTSQGDPRHNQPSPGTSQYSGNPSRTSPENPDHNQIARTSPSEQGESQAKPDPRGSSGTKPLSSRPSPARDAPRNQRARRVEYGEVPPPSPNMAKRPRSVSMEVVAAHDKKSRASGSGSTPATSIGDAGDRSFVQHLPRIAVPKPPGDRRTELEDERDPQMCEEYAPEIFAYAHRIQDTFMVDPAYIEAMPADHRWPRNRRTLINWLLTVHRKFHLVAETLFLATNIIDRFLSANLRQAAGPADVLPLGQVQLLAAAALFIAAKYEEVMSPAIGNFAFIANCQDEDIRAMEKQVLITINFDLGAPCPLNFLRRVSKADDYDMNTRTVAKFLLEAALFEPRLMVYRPSDVAAAAMLAAQMILLAVHHDQTQGSADPDSRAMAVSASLIGEIDRPTGWNAAFEYYSGGLTAHALKPIVTKMLRYLRGPCEKLDPDFIKKYSSRKALSAAVLAIEWARNSFRDRRASPDDRMEEHA